jgi:hypothetical protein
MVGTVKDKLRTGAMTAATGILTWWLGEKSSADLWQPAVAVVAINGVAYLIGVLVALVRQRNEVRQRVHPPLDVRVLISHLQKVSKKGGLIGDLDALWLLNRCAEACPGQVLDYTCHEMMTEKCADVQRKRMRDRVTLVAYGVGQERAFHPLFDVLVERGLATFPLLPDGKPDPDAPKPGDGRKRLIWINARGLEVWRWARMCVEEPACQRGPYRSLSRYG